MPIEFDPSLPHWRRILIIRRWAAHRKSCLCSNGAYKSCTRNRSDGPKVFVLSSTRTRLRLHFYGTRPQYLFYWTRRLSCQHMDSPSCKLVSGKTFCTLWSAASLCFVVDLFAGWLSQSRCIRQVPESAVLIRETQPRSRASCQGKCYNSTLMFDQSWAPVLQCPKCRYPWAWSLLSFRFQKPVFSVLKKANN